MPRFMSFSHCDYYSWLRRLSHFATRASFDPSFIYLKHTTISHRCSTLSTFLLNSSPYSQHSSRHSFSTSIISTKTSLLASRPASAAKAANSIKRSTATENNSIAAMFSNQKSASSTSTSAPKPLKPIIPNVVKPPPSKMANICGASSSAFDEPPALAKESVAPKPAAKQTVTHTLRPDNPFASDQFAKDHGFDDLCLDDFSDDPLGENGPPAALPVKTPAAPQRMATEPPPPTIDLTEEKKPVLHKNPSTSSENKRPLSEAAMAEIPTKAVKRQRLPAQFDKIEEPAPMSVHTQPVKRNAGQTMARVDSLMGNNKPAFKRERTPMGDSVPSKSTSAALSGPSKSNAPAKATSVPAKTLGLIQFSQEQKDVLQLVINEGQSVFFTGPAGTGKSVLMREIIKQLRMKWTRDPEKLAITASTGLAACNIGGITLHSFAGIGLGKDDVNTLVKKIRRNAKAKNRWVKTKCLVIDEISMVDGELFDKLDQIARKIRNNGRPWGGIQLVLTGDFFQLPPVPEKNKTAKFAFDAETWGTSVNHTIGLTQVFRQKDPEFAYMLNEMRQGRISDQTVQAFRALNRPLNFNDGLDITELFPRREQVDQANLSRLSALKGAIRTYSAADTGDQTFRDKLLSNMMCPKVLQLKEEAQVMLIKNKDEGQLYNGLIGKVKFFATELEWAAELAKSGMGDPEFAAFDKKSKFMKAAEKLADGTQYPVVDFPVGPNGQMTRIHCVPEEWKVELPNGEVQATRKQVPLILAWALSIHKAQGQTLDRVKVDLRGIFEKGQAYVALSRATSQAGLQVIGFDKSKVSAHPLVTEFYSKLYSVDKINQKRQVHITDVFGKVN